MKRVAAIFLLLMVVSHPAQASVEAGAAKWRAGDWDGALAEWTTPAARGEPEALFNLGQAYRLGRGVQQSSQTAIDYYRRAADKGHVPATTNLGITLYQEGRKAEGLSQLRTAADLGDLRASYVLGVATFGGDGAPRNAALGYAYVVRARDGGLAIASGQAARMATRMSEQDRARGEAAATALEAGRPVAVVLAEMGAAGPGTVARFDPEPEELTEDQAEAAAKQPTGADAAASKPERSQPFTPVPVKGRQANAREPEAAKAGDVERSDGWRVQLGAYTSTRAARTAWATLVSQSAAVLKGQTPAYAQKGGLVRLQVGPFDDRSTASDLCTKLAAAGRPCFITR
ncbi:MAG: SPOR domain-containing protein [Sandaracinobacteroides sp.]